MTLEDLEIQLASERTARHALEQEHVNLTRLREQAISISLMLGQAMGEQGTLTECVRRLIDAKEAAEAKLSQLQEAIEAQKRFGYTIKLYPSSYGPGEDYLVIVVKNLEAALKESA